MPEHVHLLISEPEREGLARAIQSLKQSVARRLALRAAEPFWQARYYDFNVWSERKFVEKLRYIHRNPVTRELVVRPRTGSGAASGTISRESRVRWKSNSSGQRGRVRGVGSFPQRGYVPRKTPAQAELERGTLGT